MIFDKDQVDSASSTDDCVRYPILHMKHLFGIASFLYN